MSSAPAAMPWLGPGVQTPEEITALICAPLLTRLSWRQWWLAFALASAATIMMVISVWRLFVQGVGIWGTNTTVVWGFAIANYVWWLGIGHAGTLISALLLLTRQKWRASLNRFAETMTLFAVAIAGLFPIFHLGRPYFLYWLVPYPNRMGLWPQWKSALVWDFWAVSTYILFSLLFWYVGLIPDLAILRDRARVRFVRKVYGAFALGWRGSARHWEIHDRLYRAMAATAIPLVVSVHSIVSLDFAASLMPGWQTTIYPPYFVVGALYSGFAMVVVIAAALRYGLGFESLITVRHFEVIARVLLTAAIVMGICYATEWFSAWYSGERAEWNEVVFEFTGTYWPMFASQLFFNVVLPQALWLPRIRTNIVWVVIIAIGINIGMWLERILLIWNTLGHGYMPSSWRVFFPTFWDWSLLFGSIGFFLFLYLIAVRALPVIPIHETHKLLYAERKG
jgi:Ni/Fe-hydrogenase subunit HybB-like protein